MTWEVRNYFREFGNRDPVTQEYIPVHPQGTELEAWQAWFLRHGIDPGEVALAHWVERRPTENKIVYLEESTRDGEPITREVVVQLDTEPAPFPVP
jgi:hypothetical protein